MKVTTIDGGFRGRKGMGSLTTTQVLDEVESFQGRLVLFREAVVRVRRQITAGELPVVEARQIEAVARELEDLIDAHIASSAELRTSADLLDWRTRAGRLVDRASAFVATTMTAVRAESTTRPWKIALGLTLGASAVALLVWGLGQVEPD